MLTRKEGSDQLSIWIKTRFHRGETMFETLVYKYMEISTWNMKASSKSKCRRNMFKIKIEYSARVKTEWIKGIWRCCPRLDQNIRLLFYLILF